MIAVKKGSFSSGDITIPCLECLLGDSSITRDLDGGPPARAAWPLQRSTGPSSAQACLVGVSDETSATSPSFRESSSSDGRQMSSSACWLGGLLPAKRAGEGRDQRAGAEAAAAAAELQALTCGEGEKDRDTRAGMVDYLLRLAARRRTHAGA